MTGLPLAKRVAQICRLARLTPFETETEQGRSDERHRRMMLSSIASAVAKAISILTALISVPLTLNYLGTERYGMWLTISSFITILSFADFGLGNGLLSQVAVAHGRNDRAAMRAAVSSAFGMLATISLVFLACFIVAYPFVSWYRIFNVMTPLAMTEAGPAICVFAVCFAIAIPAAIVQKVQIGLQNSFVPSLWSCLGSVAGLCGVVIATQLGLGLPWLVLAFVGGPLAAAIANSLAFFMWYQPDLAPQRASFSMAAALSMAKTGGLFLVLQVVASTSYASDPLVISHVLGATAVPQYSVPERMFGLVGMVVTMGLAPLWPAYGEAISRADHRWVRTTLMRSITIAVAVAGVGALALVIAGPALLNMWVGPTIRPLPILFIGLAIWKVLEAAGIAIAMFLNAAHVVRFQVFTAITSAILIVLLKFLFVSQFGISGSIWATITGWTFLTLIPTALMLSRILGNVTRLSKT